MIVLASSSPWRLALLQSAGIEATPIAPDVDEAGIVRGSIVETAEARALAKASKVARSVPGDLVLGADQVVTLGGHLFGKPASQEAWLEQLMRLRGETHLLITAMALVGGGALEVWSERSQVRFRRDVTDAELEEYVALGEAAGCAGGYKVEGAGAWLIESVNGDWNNVVGLPVFSLIGRLRARGWRIGPKGAVPPAGMG